MTNIVQEMTSDYKPIWEDDRMRRITDKWRKTGLLKKLDEGNEKIVARLLENQAVELRQRLDENSVVGDIAGFNKIAFPLVRRVFGQLLASELVAVQPMSLPAGLLFFLDFKFDRAKSGQGSGESVYGLLNNGPPNNNPGLDAVGEQAASGGFYNLNTGYSKRIFALTTTTAPTYSGVTATSELLGGVTVSGYNFTLASSGATDLKSLHEIRVATSGEMNFDTTNTFRSLKAIHSLTGASKRGQTDHTMTVLTGALIQVFMNVAGTLSPPSTWSANSSTGMHLVGPAATNVSTDSGTNNLGDFEATSAIPEINIAVSSVAVVAQTRKLKAQWTPELAQDLNAYHALDAEVELTTILSEVITTEIDRDILGQLLSGAAVKAAWSRAIGRYVSYLANDVVNTLNPTSSYTYQSFHGTQQDWYQTLGETLTTVSNEIHKRNLRSGANWMVTSPDVCSILESIATFKPNAVFDPTEVQYSLGIEKIGSLSNRFTVYKDPYFPVNKILLGYKGAGFLDAGFVYAPYVPLVVTPTIFEPNDFTPRKGVMHRAATQMVRPEYYGRITVADLNVIGSPASV
jgi:hypothetical protein